MKRGKALAKQLLLTVCGEEMTHILTMFKYDMQRVVSPTYCKSRARLQTYRDKHLGKRCIIIGNGPSLQRMDLAPLRHEITFGLNRIYLLFDQLGFSTTYFVSVNRHVIAQCSAEILQLPCPKFISWEAHRLIAFAPDVVFMHSNPYPKFCTDVATEGAWEGATVTYVAMQLAYYMGFQQVILIGVDHAYQTQGPPHQLITSQGTDVNHFHPAYFGKGFQWQLPDLDVSEMAYRLAKRAFEQAGREILDATVDGKLTVFRKADYHTLFRPSTAS